MAEIECIFIERLPSKLIYDQYSDSTLNLKDMIISGVSKEHREIIFTVDPKDIKIEKNIDTTISGLQTVMIMVFNIKLAFSVYIRPISK